MLVVARTDLEAEKLPGLTAFMLETRPRRRHHRRHPRQAGRAGRFDRLDRDAGCAMPAENRLGEEGEGFKIAMSCLDNGRYTVAPARPA